MLKSPRSDLAEFRTHPKFYGCPPYLQIKEDLIKNEGARVVTRFSPIITLLEQTVTMETIVMVRSGQKPNAANSLPQ